MRTPRDTPYKWVDMDIHSRHGRVNYSTIECTIQMSWRVARGQRRHVNTTVPQLYDVQIHSRHVHVLYSDVEYMGWLRLVGSFKLSVSFAKEPYKRDDVLQKRPTILRSLLIVATSYHADGSTGCPRAAQGYEYQYYSTVKHETASQTCAYTIINHWLDLL